MTARTIKPADVDRDTNYGEDTDWLEYGIQLPNGKIWWSTGNPPAPHLRGVDWQRLNLQINQDAAQISYAEWMDRQGVVYDPDLHRLRFVQRRQQIRYTVPEPLEGQDLQEFESPKEAR